MTLHAGTGIGTASGSSSAGSNNNSISLQPIDVELASSAGLAAVPSLPSGAQLDFANVAGSNGTLDGTITLTNGGSWSSLGYSVGGGIYVQGTDADANGTTFDATGPNPYYTIKSISGSTLTLTSALLGSLDANQGTENNVSDNVAPVLVNLQGGLAGTPTATQVSFANSGANGTISLASGNWASLGYSVGQGIYISSGLNANETFNATDPGTYYTITGINGSTLTLAEALGQTGSNVTVDLVPVNVGSSLTATTTDGAIYVASPTEGLQIRNVTAGGDQAVNISALGSIFAAGATGYIGGGNVTIDAKAGGSVGIQDTPIQLNVGQQSADQLNLTASGGVYLEQQQGNLAIFQITTDGAVDITVDNGSVVNVNTNIEQDPRTVAELEQGVWTALKSSKLP